MLLYPVFLSEPWTAQRTFCIPYDNPTSGLVVVDLHSTIREEEVHWPEFGVFNFRVLQIIGFQYFTFNLSVFKYFSLPSNFEDY